MTIKQLRAALNKLPAGHEDKQVVIWLPGSIIDLQTTLMLRDDTVMIEGNIRPRSALSAD